MKASEHLAMEGRDARRHLREYHAVEEVRDDEARQVHQWEHEIDAEEGPEDAAFAEHSAYLEEG